MGYKLPSPFFSLPAQIEVLAAGEVRRRRNQTLTSVLHLESGRVLRGVYEDGRMRHQLGVVEGPFWLDAAAPAFGWIIRRFRRKRPQAGA